MRTPRTHAAATLLLMVAMTFAGLSLEREGLAWLEASGQATRAITTTGVVFIRAVLGNFPISIGGLGTTSTDGLSLTNPTAATVGTTVQYSPRLKFCGAAWKSNATAASEADCWIIENRPATGAAATTSTLFFSSSLNGGAYTDIGSMTSGGNVTTAANTGRFAVGAFGSLGASADGVWGFQDNAGTSFGRINLGLATSAFPSLKRNGTTVEARLGDDSAYTGFRGTTFNAATALQLSGVVLASATAPTATTFCTSPSVPSSNGTAAFTINVGTTCVTSVGTITLPAATTAWVVSCFNVTAPATNVVSQTGGTTTTATVTNYVRTTGIAGNWTDSNILRCSAMGY